MNETTMSALICVTGGIIYIYIHIHTHAAQQTCLPYMHKTAQTVRRKQLWCTIESLKTRHCCDHHACWKLVELMRWSWIQKSHGLSQDLAVSLLLRGRKALFARKDDQNVWLMQYKRYPALFLMLFVYLRFY